jgi:integrase/recombinase XerC
VNELERFISYLSLEKRFSKHTIIAYQGDLTQFRDYLVTQYQLEDFTQVSHFIIRSWAVSLIEQGLDTRSVNRKLTCLRTFYRFLMKNQLVTKNPMQKVQAPKNSSKLPEYLEDQKMDQLLEPKLDDSSYEALRNNLIIDFFYRTGVRLSELINIKINDVNLYNLTVTVLGKRNKMRQIPLTNKFKVLIQKYLVARSDFMKEKGTVHDYFFTENNGNQMYPKFVYRLVKTEISKVSTSKKRSPHILRHTFATTMLNHGADINAIKELLGHSSLAATQVYTHNSIEKLKEIYKQAFPKA